MDTPGTSDLHTSQPVCDPEWQKWCGIRRDFSICLDQGSGAVAQPHIFVSPAEAWKQTRIIARWREMKLIVIQFSAGLLGPVHVTACHSIQNCSDKRTQSFWRLIIEIGRVWRTRFQIGTFKHMLFSSRFLAWSHFANFVRWLKNTKTKQDESSD